MKRQVIFVILVLALLCVSALADRSKVLSENQQVMPPPQMGPRADPQMLWSRYRDSLLNFIRKGTQAYPGLQIVTEPLPADFITHPHSFHQMVDRIPEVDGAYKPTGRHFSDEYTDWLNNLAITRTVNPMQQQYIEALDKAEEDFINADTACKQLYEQKCAQSGAVSCASTPYTEFCCGGIIPKCPRLVQAKKNLNDAIVKSKEASIDADAVADRLAIQAITKLNYLKRNNQTFDWDFFGDYNSFIQDSFNGRGYAAKFMYSTKSTFSHESEKSRSFSFSIGIQFISLSYSQSKSEFKMTTTENQFEIHFGFDNIRYFPVSPNAAWFTPQALKMYKNRSLKRPVDYFSTSGRMPMYTKGLVIATGPRVTLFLNNFDAQRLEKDSQKGFGIGIGPISFNFAKGSGFKVAVETENTWRVTLEGSKTEPVVLAVDNELLWNL